MGHRRKEWNLKQNCEICQLKARINIEYLSAFSAKYQNCINDDGKHHFKTNRQLTENKQHFLHWRRAGWQNWFNPLGYSDTVGFFWYFVISDLIFHIPWPIWPIYYDTYLPIFLLAVKRGRERWCVTTFPEEDSQAACPERPSVIQGSACQIEQLWGLLQLWLPPFPRTLPQTDWEILSVLRCPPQLIPAHFHLGVCVKYLILWAATPTIELEVN